MKRLQERDTPPKNKRSRTNYNDPDDRDRDRPSPDLERREGRPPGKHGPARDQNCQKSRRDRSVHSGRDYELDLPKRRKDERACLSEPYQDLPPRERPMYSTGGGASTEYRTLCVSNLHPRVADGAVRDALYKEFEKFGDFNVKVVHNGELPRIAYVNFRYAENAREAKRSRSKMMLFEMPVRIEAVFSKRQRCPSPDLYPALTTGRDLYPRGSVSPPPPLPPGRRLSRHTPDMVMPPHPIEPDFPPNFDDPNWSAGYQQHHEQRFPHHLHHIQPEDDEKATRTLFVGNLDYDISEEDLDDIFCRYGTLEDIDIKRPIRGTGNAYAFVKFINLDMSHRAKLEMSGHYIGKYQCKIGYGKATPSTCLWIGGLGPWVSIETLHQELDRFGVIRQIEWPRDKSYAYVLFDSIDAALAACQGLRGVALGGRNHRLRVDFADPAHILELPPRYQPNSKSGIDLADVPPEFNEDAGQGRGYGQWNKRYNGRGRTQRNDWQQPERNEYRNMDNAPRNRRWNREESSFGNDNPGRRNNNNNRYEANHGYRTHAQAQSEPRDAASPSRDRDVEPRNSGAYSPATKRRRRRTSGDEHSSSSQFDKDHANSDGDHHDDRTKSGLLTLGDVGSVTTISDLAKCLPVVWSGALVLKTSAFAARMHLVSGDVHIVDTLMRDPTTTEMPVLRITQRLRLDQTKLDEVARRITLSGANGHSILLAMPGPPHALDDQTNTKVQQRPLRNIVSYLKQKEAAGVIALPPNPSKDRANVGVLHAFPPCQFGNDYLSACAQKLNFELAKEDYLVVVVVRGAT
ncbi:RNA-binding protein spenito [Lamellibrachia satsuma]|nr:RNA-binding protein spenito [Lamellibrachia satsuma]